MILMKKFTFLLFSLVFFVVNISSAQAVDEPKVDFEVNHVANVVEKFKEKISLFFNFSNEGKLKYQKFLLETRLAELKYVIDSKEWDPVEETSSRYATYLSKFSEFVEKSNFKDQKGEILSIYDRHEKIIEALQRNFEYDSGWWLLLQHDRNLLKMFSAQLNK